MHVRKSLVKYTTQLVGDALLKMMEYFILFFILNFYMLKVMLNMNSPVCKKIMNLDWSTQIGFEEWPNHTS